MGLKAERENRQRQEEWTRRCEEVVKGGPDGVRGAVALAEEVEPDNFPDFVKAVFPAGGMDETTFNALCDGYDLYAHARAVKEAPETAVAH